MGKQWYVIYTSPKGEKKANQRLEAKGIETFLPLQKTMRQWSDRKKKVEMPLFKSYLFVKLDLIREKYQVLETPGVVCFVNYLREPAIVRDHEITAIANMLANYTEISAESIAVGQKVKVNGGTLKGQEGIVEDFKNNTVTLLLESVGFYITAKIPMEQLMLV